MEQRPNQTQTRGKTVLRAAVAFVCALSLVACTRGTPLEGTPVAGPINKLGELVGIAGDKLGELLQNVGGPSYDEAFAARAAETAPAIDDADLVEAGYLTVGLQNSTVSAPFVIESNTGKLQGIDVDLSSAIASQLGLKVRFVPVLTVDSALSAGECDVVMSASADRVNSSTVLGSYSELATAFFHVGSEGAVDVSELDGKTVGLQAGSVSQSALDGTSLNMQQSFYSNLNEAFDALEAGEVDFVLCDAYPGAYLASTYSDISFAGAISAPSTIGIASSTSNVAVQTAVKDALDQVMVNGQMDIIRGKIGREHV